MTHSNTLRNIKTTFSVIILSVSTIYAESNHLTINDLYGSDKYQSYIDYFESSPDGENFIVNDGRQLVSFDYAHGDKMTTLIDLDEIKDCPISNIEGFSMSKNSNIILLYTNSEEIHRYSYKADYYIYNIQYKELKKVSENKIQNAIVAPNGWLVAYVYNNNIYVKKLKYDSESPITNDGEINITINGIPDWVNEEEFSTTSSMAWSDDSKELAFIKYNERDVKEYELQMYKCSYPSYDENYLYPSKYTYKYPKAGEKNSDVSVCVYNIDNRKTKVMDLGNDKDFYVPRILWTHTPNELCIVKLNRRQNKMDVLIANTATTVCRSLYTENNKKYVEEDEFLNITFLPDGQNVVCTSERDGYRHIYLYGTNGVEKGQLTSGNWDVANICGYEPTSKTLIFTAAKNTPLEKDIFSINIEKKTLTQLSKGGGTYNAYVSESGKYYVQLFSNTTTPPTETIYDFKGVQKRVIDNNSELVESLKSINIVNKEFSTFTNSNGDKLNYWIMKPQNFNPSGQYPVLVVQYCGPSSQEVKNEWNLDWEQTLCAEGYIVACVDSRGTGFRGEEFRKCTYLKLGKYECEDLIEFAKYLGEQNYIDSGRIGIWGWSFGAFTSALCLCKSDVYKIGIAVAPVTNWRYYDTIYTERYMRTPEENPSGYDDNSPIFLADKLQGRLFLIHASADDNVHLQNQLEFVDALAIAGKQFDMFTYPNRNHSIYGGPIRTHLYTMMLEYVKNNL